MQIASLVFYIRFESYRQASIQYFQWGRMRELYMVSNVVSGSSYFNLFIMPILCVYGFRDCISYFSYMLFLMLVCPK